MATVSSVPVLSSTTPSSVPTGASNVASTQDFQNQMMTLLNATFTKLTTVLMDHKATETKADRPKFSGDTKKFRHWYLAIVAQLLLAPWKEFYDPNSNTLVKTTLNTTLNEKLYAKLLLCLEGQVFQEMVSRKHLQANGLQHLHEYLRPIVLVMFQMLLLQKR